jgi:hypothetical protein
MANLPRSKPTGGYKMGDKVAMRDLLADKAMCEAATPEPWEHWEFSGADMEHNGFWITTDATRDWSAICSFGVNPSERDKANAEFICQARVALPHAIDRAIAAEAALITTQRNCDEAQGEAELWKEVSRMLNAERKGQSQIACPSAGEPDCGSHCADYHGAVCDTQLDLARNLEAATILADAELELRSARLNVGEVYEREVTGNPSTSETAKANATKRLHRAIDAHEAAAKRYANVKHGEATQATAQRERRCETCAWWKRYPLNEEWGDCGNATAQEQHDMGGEAFPTRHDFGCVCWKKVPHA